jgi:hypothetical protein
MSTVKLNQTGAVVDQLQKHVDSTLNKAELDWLRVKVDGNAGPLTFKASRIAASWQGFSTAHLKEIGDGLVSEPVFAVLAQDGPRSEEMKKRGEDRRKNFAKMRDEHNNPPEDADGVSDWKGFKVASWMVGERVGPDGQTVNWLQKSVDAGWDGDLNSAWRSPAYSESLCLNMCGAPSCPNRCAGKTSNHSQVGPPNWGAVDVQDYARFGGIQAKIGSPLKNLLGTDDPVHFSFTGR